MALCFRSASRSQAKTKPDEGELTLIRETKMDLKPSDFISEQVFYTSKDGTRIPVRIAPWFDAATDSAPADLPPTRRSRR
jgi:prolyl oligopeptidase PreP (S9A serine peptidase family)